MAATSPSPFRTLPDSQRAWLAERLARPAPPAARGLSDGFASPVERVSRSAAVLVPLVNRPQGLQLLLTQRSETLADHPGQISFPGGRLDLLTPTTQPPLRETAEIGLPPARSMCSASSRPRR